MSFVIRPFNKESDADYETVVAIRNEITPEHAITVAELKDGEKRRDPICKQGRWIAETVGTGEGIGCGGFGQSSWAYDPQRFGVSVSVRPGQERNGVGKALYQTIMAELETHSPTELHANVREDWVRGLQFAANRGFGEEMREWESRLDVSAFDASRWGEVRQRPLLAGIEIRSYTELADDAERDRKFYALIDQTFRDVPSTVPLTPPPFERFQEQILQSPNFLPDGVMIAIDAATGQYVGSSEVSKRQSCEDLDTGLTGVLRDYRGRGIALALKLKIIDFAITRGTPVISTQNATTNRAMLSINEALGFVKQPAWIALARRTPQNQKTENKDN